MLDTRSGNHLCADLNDFIEYHAYTDNDHHYQYEAANGGISSAKGYGKVQIDLKLNNGSTNPIFVDAYYAPNS